jgi:serine/threonine protein kinase
MTGSAAPKTRLFRFSPFELDVRAGELRKHGIRIKLREQPVQILHMLLEHPGEVVLREDIRLRLWPNNTIVEFDHGINAAIQKLRDALGESADKPRYVETVARRGYRLLGEVERVGEPQPEPAQETPPPDPPVASTVDTGDLTGQTLSHYRILSKLGAGGMGVVYRAEDLRLGRTVALKFLPCPVGELPESMIRRFEREARAASALNHPNICTIHGLEDFAGQPVIVMELVEGETLAARLAKGPLPLERVMPLAIQIAGALAEAHRKGIVHRDLKPANIMLGKAGVKVLDFGVAKIEPAAALVGDGTASMTQAGTIMGTLHYLSPEQAQGKEADARSDIFSFGAVLYEMLTGRRAFDGDNPVGVMAAILEHEVPSLAKIAPAQLDLVVGRCLAKDPEDRWQSARDLGFALASVSQASQSVAERPGQSLDRQSGKSPRIRRGLLLALAAPSLIALAFAAGRFLLSPPASPQWSGVALGGPEMALNPRLSPDGHLIAFQAMNEGLNQVAVMKPESGNWAILTHQRDRGTILQISWSPDGALIYYDRGSGVPKGVFSVPVLGGDEHMVLDNARSPEALPDGSLLLSRRNPQQRLQVFRFWPDTGRIQDFPLEIGYAGSTYASLYASGFRMAPGGKEAIALASPIGRGGEGIGFFGIDLVSNGIRRLPPTAQQTASIRGWGVSRDGTTVIAAVRAASMWRLLAIPTSGHSAERTLFTVTNSSVWYLDSGPDGSVYAALADQLAEIERLSTSGEPSERIAGWSRVASGAAEQILMLPDGRAIVPAVSSGHVSLVAIEKGKDAVPLVKTPEETSPPMTLAGPGVLAFVIGPSPHQTIALAEIASGRITGHLTPAKDGINSLTSSPDGRTLYFGAGGSIWAIAYNGGDSRRVCAGNTALMEPSGHSLTVTRVEGSKVTMFHVFLNGDPEREIPLDSAMPLDISHLGGISSGSMDTHGRLLASLFPPDSWFNPLGILDTATGRITRLTSENLSDHHSAVWTSDGHILATKLSDRVTIWKFQPEKP